MSRGRGNAAFPTGLYPLSGRLFDQKKMPAAFSASYGIHTKDMYFYRGNIFASPVRADVRRILPISLRFARLLGDSWIETCHEIKDFGLGLQPAPTWASTGFFDFVSGWFRRMLSQKFTITTIPYTPVGASLLARRMCATIKNQFSEFISRHSPISIEAR